MVLNTCSEAISLSRELENQSAKLYEEIAQKYTKDEETLLSFVKENKKNVVNIERVYFSTISDAIEGCFAFELEPEKYVLDTSLDGVSSYSDALGKAIKVEEVMVNFYHDAGEQAKTTLADIPRAFTLASKKKNERIEKLKAL